VRQPNQALFGARGNPKIDFQMIGRAKNFAIKDTLFYRFFSIVGCPLPGARGAGLFGTYVQKKFYTFSSTLRQPKCLL
jgi:hypothetical protein